MRVTIFVNCVFNTFPVQVDSLHWIKMYLYIERVVNALNVLRYLLQNGLPKNLMCSNRHTDQDMYQKSLSIAKFVLHVAH